MTHGQKETFIHAGIQGEEVGLVLDGGKAIPAVTRDSGLTESAVRAYVVRCKADAGRGDPTVLTMAEHVELSQLRRENRQLRMEREILNKMTAFFAKGST